MADEHVERLLAAEQKARELVAVLEKLKQEVESYRDARLAIDKVAEGLSGATVQLGKVAGDADTVVRQLKAIGTPEILSKVGSVESAVSSLAGRLGVRLDDIVRRASATDEAVAQLVTAVATVERGVSTAAESANKVSLGLQKASQDNLDALRLAAADAGSQREGLRQQLSQIQSVVIGLGVLTLLGLAIVGWLAAR